MILGIDLGTTGCKAVLFSPSGEIMGESYLEYDVYSNNSHMVEQNADEWWKLTREVIRLVLKNSRVTGEKVKALSVSSQGIAFTLVSPNGKAITPVFSWLDTRARKETEEIINKISFKQIYQITGKRVSPSYVLPKLLWIRKNAHKPFNASAKVAMGEDFIINKFTGDWVTDHTMAAGTLMYDISRLGWSDKILNTFRIPKEKLPRIAWSGTSVGKLQDSVAKELNLSNNTVVVLGGQDQKCAAYGANIKKGVATLSLGTAAVITVLIDEPILDKKMRIPCFPFVEKNKWVLEAVISTGGASLKWIRNLLESIFSKQGIYKKKIDYPFLDRLARKSPPGSNGIFFYPHLSGVSSPYWNDKLQGMFKGITLATEIEDMLRAVMEGVAYEIKLNLEVIEDLVGTIHTLRIFGGGARSELWCDIISNITSKKVEVCMMPDSVANKGAARIAGSTINLALLNWGNPIHSNYKHFKGTDSNIYQKIFDKYIQFYK